MRVFARGSIVLWLQLCACGGGGVDYSEWTGIYQVSLHQRNEAGCGSGDSVQEEPYFLLKEEEFIMGAKYLSLSLCTAATADTCSGGGLLGDSFTEEAEGGFDGRIGFSSFSAPTCLLTFRHLTLRRLEPERVRIEIHIHQDEPTLTEEQCFADQAISRGATMPCIEFEAIEGGRLGG